MLSDSDIRERLGPLTDPTPPPDKSPRRRALSAMMVLVIFVVILWGVGIGAIVHLERTSPQVPDPASGHIRWFSDSLHTRYLTQKGNYLAWGAVVVPALATLALAAFAVFRPKPPDHY